ncbi:MAG TPA: flagellar biosynthesis anti-sigma factor FlgM [Polyangiaceae bacterium]|nr:flagellar biosynthesis anti-sigma factor FlgM [Polyangiaceae bacterium]
MKGITGHSALEAYRRVALSPVNSTSKAAEQQAPAAVERQPVEAAKVSISSEARDLASKGDASVSSQKVESLKTAISDGSFKVNSHLVASRLLDTLG